MKGHQPEVNNKCDKEIIFHIHSEGQYWLTITSYSWRILIAQLFWVILTMTTAPRQNTWLIQSFLGSSLHFPNKNHQQGHNQWLTNIFLGDALFLLRHCFRVFPIKNFYNHSLYGVGCISSKRQSVTVFNVKWIYINNGIFTDSDYRLFESFIWNFIQNSRSFNIVTSVI